MANTLTPVSPPSKLLRVFSSPSVNQEVLKNIREEVQVEGEVDVVTELIDLFFEDTLKQLQGIKAAINNSATDALRANAHALKGSCQNLGVLPMGEIAASLEKKCSGWRDRKCYRTFHRIRK